jgi:hypothetical protein
MKKKLNPRAPKPVPATKKPATLGEKKDIDSEKSQESRPELKTTRASVRRALVVSRGTVRFCTWNGDEPHHAHAIHHVAPGAVISVGDDVPREALGDFVAFHYYRRVGDECLMVRGDGSLM